MRTLRTSTVWLVMAFILMSQVTVFSQTCKECDEEINYGGELILCENFENAIPASNILNLPNWNVFPAPNRTSGKIVGTPSYQGNRSGHFEYSAAATADLNFRFNQTAPIFDYHVATKLFVPDGKTAIVKLLDNNSATKYIIDFGKNDTAFVRGSTNGTVLASFRYPKGNWFRLSNLVRVATKKVEIFVGGKQVANLNLPNPSIAIPNNLNFSAPNVGNDFYVDNICFVRNKKVGFVANCTATTEPYCVGGVFNDLSNECTLGSENGYIPLEFSKGTCNVTLGCTPACNVSSGAFQYFIGKDGNIYCFNNFCSGTGLTYEWQVLTNAANYIFTKGTQSSDQNIVIAPAKADIYTIVEKVKDASGNVVNSSSQNINFNPTACSDAPLLNIQFQSIGNGRFIFTTNNSQNISNIAWKVLDINNQEAGSVQIVGSSTNPEFIKTKPGLVKVVATASNECGTSTTSYEVSDNTCQASCPSVVDQITNVKPNLNGKILTFNGLPTDAAYKYSWKVVGFGSISVAAVANPTIVLPEFGLYTVCCEITKTTGTCTNRSSMCFSINAEDDTQCFNSNCGDLRFYHSGNVAKPLEYIFVATNAGATLSWKVKNLTTNQVTTISSAALTQTIDFSNPQYGGAGDYAIAFKGSSAAGITCCGIKVKVGNPFVCGASTINYTLNKANNNFVFTATKTGGIFLVDNGANEPKILNAASLPIPTPCGARNISYRYLDAAGFWNYCSRKVAICNPFDCNNINIDYVASGKLLKLSVKNQPVGSSDFSWSEEYPFKAIGAAQSINYPIVSTTPCTSITYALRYFDGNQWILCQVPISNCNPDDCAASIQFSYSANTGNGQLILTSNLTNISNLKWYIDDAEALGINKNVKAGKYKVSLVYYDNIDNSYKICSKSIKVGDDCFTNTDCDQLKFYFNNDPVKPLKYTFAALTTGSVIQWRIKNVKDNKTFVTNSGIQQSLDFAQYGGEGEYIICYEYQDAKVGDPSGCCCTKVCIASPYDCGDANISYEYNAALKSFVFQYNGAIAGGNGEWVQYQGLGNEPKVLANGSYPVPASCVTETIGFRFKDAVSNCVRVCYKTLQICNPFDCNNIDVAFSQSKNAFQFSLKSTTGVTKYKWTEDVSKTSLGTNATANLGFANAICDTRIVSANYYDGQKWILCSVPVYQCNPEDCATFINENIANNKFSSVSVAANFTNVSWYINDAKVGTGNNFDVTKLTPGDYKISALFYDASAKYYRVCTKTITIGDECFTKSDCKDLNFIYTGKAKGELKFTFTVADTKGLINWQVKKDGEPNVTNIASTNGTLEIDFNKLTGEGDYTICASKASGCCCIKVAIKDPNDCNDIEYVFNEATNNFEFTFKPTGNFTKNTWLNETGQVISTPNISVVPCATRTISYRYYDAAFNIFRYCSRTVEVCNPFDCKSTLIDYKPSTKVVSFNLVNIAPNSKDFYWTIDDKQSLGNLQGASYKIPTPAPCQKQVFAARYFDGSKWILCSTPFYNCNPDDCGDNISFTYLKSKLDFSTNANFTVVQWFINDNKAKEKGNDIVPGTYIASVLYYDNTAKYYRVCSKTIVLDDECYQDPVCDNLTFYQSGGLNEPLKYVFVADKSVGTTDWKIKKVGATTETVLKGAADTKEIDFSKLGGAGDYIICATNPNGCCCIKVKVENPFDCKNMDFQFDNPSKKFSLFYNTAGLTKTKWLLEDPGKAPTELANNLVALPANCVSRVVSYRYFNASTKTWGYCSQNFYLCNPYDCGDKSIFFAYKKLGTKDNFNFVLNDPNIAAYKDLSWQVDGAIPSALAVESDKSTNYYPAAGQDCKPYTISAKYFESSLKTWILCSINVNICNPDKCNVIEVGYKGSVKIFEFSVPATAQTKGYQWSIEELQTIIGDQAKIGYLTPTTLPCNNYTVALRYYDGTAWRLCTKKMYLCDPTKCGSEINYTYDYDDVATNGTLSLNSTVSGITNIKWFIDDAQAQAVNTKINTGNYVLSIVYTDAQGVTKICSRKVQLTGGVDKFTLIANKTSVSPVQEAVVEIRSKNFLKIANFQFTTQWNPAILKLKTEEKNLVIGTTTFDKTQTAAGFIGIKWAADNPQVGESYPDNAILYKLRFEVVGKLGDESIIDFVNNVLSIKVTDSNGGNVPFTKETGSVKITTTSSKDVSSASNLFKLYPNPANQTSTLSFDPTAVNVKTITLFDMQGKAVYHKDNLEHNGFIEIELNDIMNGLYLLKIETDDKIFSDRLMIIR